MSYITALLVTLLVGVLACRILIGQAELLKLVDHPVGRKDHQHPIPVVGGIAVFFAIACGWWVLDGSSLKGPPLGFVLAAALLVGVGAADDIHDLPWPVRILVQCFAALVLVDFGSQISTLSLSTSNPALPLGVFATVFTVFAVVGLINATNMVDGIDGLAGSVVSASLLMMAALAAWSGDMSLSSHLLVALAAVAAFLAFNLRFPGRAKALTFLGNSGSAVLGLLLAWAAIELTQAPGARVSPCVAPWLVALPILDCLTLIGRRMAGGRSPFAADRMHFHHLLVDRGFSVPSVVVLGVMLHLVVAGCGLLLMALGASDITLIVGFLVVLAGYAVSVTLAFSHPRMPSSVAMNADVKATE